MHADVVEPGLLGAELLVTRLDELERRIRDVLVVVAPLPHQAVRVVVDLGRVRDVVALPGIRRVLLDLLVDIRQIAAADVQEPVREHARRARNLVDEIARSSRLRRRQDLAVERLAHVSRRAAAAALDRDDRRRDVAQ